MNPFRKRPPLDRPLEVEEKAKVIGWTRDGFDAERIAERLRVPIHRVKDYLNRPLDSADKMVIRTMSKEGHDSLYIARQIGCGVVPVASYMDRMREFADEKERGRRAANPSAAVMQDIRGSIAEEVAARIGADPGLRRKLVDAEIDSVMRDIGAKKDPPKGNALVETVGYLAGTLGEGGLSNLFRMAIPATQRESLLENRLAQTGEYIRQLETRLNQLQASPEPPQLTTPVQPPAETQESPDVDWPQQFIRWIGMAPAVAAAEASVAIRAPDAPIQPPFVTITPRQVMALSSPEIVDLLTNNPAFRMGVPEPVRAFLSTPAGQEFWAQFQSSLRFPEAAA